MMDTYINHLWNTESLFVKSEITETFKAKDTILNEHLYTKVYTW